MKLSNVQKGYAEFEWVFEDHTYYGYVEIEKFVVKTDFEKDEIIYTSRWVPYMTVRKYLTRPRNRRVGRLTGYKTRQAALAAVKAYIREEVYNANFPNRTNA